MSKLWLFLFAFQPAAYFTEMFKQKDKTEEKLLAEKKYGSNLKIPDIDPDQCLQSLLTHDMYRAKTEQVTRVNWDFRKPNYSPEVYT